MAIDKTKLAVARGIRLLEQKRPDWKEHIDLSLFDMNSSSNGLLEQLYESHVAGLRALRLRSDEARDYGFDIRYDRSDEENLRQWQVLTEVWKMAILQEKQPKNERIKFSEWLQPDTVAIKATAVYFGVPGQGHQSCHVILTHKNWTGSLEQVTREEPDIEKKHCIECGKPLLQAQEGAGDE